VWFSRLLNAAVLRQLKSLRTHFLLCLFWVRVVPLLNPPPHPTMNSPFVNFKLKPGISRSLTGAALLLSTAALINAGESKAAGDFTCFLSNLSTCGGLVGDKNFSDFSLSGFAARPGDFISVSESGGYWSVQTNFTPATTGTVNGTLKYNVAIVGTQFTFQDLGVSVSGGPFTSGNPQIESKITGIDSGNSFFADVTTSPMKTFANNTKTIAVDQKFTASSPRRLGSFTTSFTQNVPGPLPLLGGAAAFGFSRRLRSRIKTSAAT